MKKEHIAIVTLNRPEKLNAFNSHMLKEFEQTLDALKFSKDIRVIIITGSGKGHLVRVQIYKNEE